MPQPAICCGGLKRTELDGSHQTVLVQYLYAKYSRDRLGVQGKINNFLLFSKMGHGEMFRPYLCELALVKTEFADDEINRLDVGQPAANIPG